MELSIKNIENGNNGLQVIDGKVVMTSLQVAEIFGKRHDDVLKAIRNEIEAGISLGSFAERDYMNRGKKYPMYVLDRDAFTSVVMDFHGKEAKQFKVAYIRAFNHMEAQLIEKAKAPSIPTNFAEALLLAANQQFQIIEQAKQLEEAKEKVETWDKICANDKTFSMGEAAKQLGYGRNSLFGFLRFCDVLDNKNVPKQQYIDRGYFEVKQTTVQRTAGLENHLVTRVTNKGIQFIDKKMAEKEAELLNKDSE